MTSDPNLPLALPSQRKPRLSEEAVLACNIVMAATSAIMIGFWFWRYTDFFEEFAAVLTLGGALSVAGTWLKLVPKEKLGKLQEIFFVRWFERRRALLGHGLVLLAVVFGGGCFASIELSLLQDATERMVVVCPAGERATGYWEKKIREEDYAVLRRGKSLRVLVPVWWSAGKDFVVKVGGYPDKVVKLHGWERRELGVPSSFRRPVMLLRPTTSLINFARHKDKAWTLEITQIDAHGKPVDGNKWTTSFDGHAVWLGCDANVDVPRFVEEKWDKEASPAHRSLLRFPRSFPQFPAELDGKERFLFRVLPPTDLGKPVESGPGEFTTPPMRDEFSPEVIVIGDPP